MDGRQYLPLEGCERLLLLAERIRPKMPWSNGLNSGNEPVMMATLISSTVQMDSRALDEARSVTMNLRNSMRRSRLKMQTSPPKEKTKVTANFCLMVILNRQTTGMGRHRINTSSANANDPMHWKNSR